MTIENSAMSENKTISMFSPEELSTLLVKFMGQYRHKPENMSDERWLDQQLTEAVPELPEAERKEFVRQAAASELAISKAKTSMNVAEERGMGRNEWLRRELRASAPGVQVQRFGAYLKGIDDTIAESNKQLAQVFLNKDGSINQNPHLSGFIFEQEQANTFNMDAALKNKDLRAEVLRPGPGETYGKNSPDLRTSSGKQYQAKTSPSQETTHKLLAEGDYKGQTPLVPKDQGIDGKSVERIEEGGVKSKPVDYQDIKEKQREAQEDGKLPQNDWNDYTTGELAVNIGKQAVASAFFSAAAGGAFELAAQVIQGDDMDAEAVAQAALEGGGKAGATTAVTAALKVAVEKGYLPGFGLPTTVPQPVPTALITPLPTPKLPIPLPTPKLPTPLPTPKLPISQGLVITAIATTAMDGVINAYKVSKGEMSPEEALKEVERGAFATVAGLAAAAKGATIGAALGTVFGPIGSAIGGFVGGTVACMAGGTIGRKVAEGVQKVQEMAVDAVKGAGKKIGSVVGCAVEKTKDLVSDLVDTLCFWR